MSTKTKIMTELKKLNQHTYYADTTYSGFPRVMVYLVSNIPLKLSDIRHKSNVTYQVSYYSNQSLDVENDVKLTEIINALESVGLVTNNWNETVDVDEKANTSTYHYFLEVR